jgi:hypothetical protein
MGFPASGRRTLRERRVEARRAGMTPRTVERGFSPGPESSMMEAGFAVAMISFLERVLCRRNPFQHNGGVAQMVRATDS